MTAIILTTIFLLHAFFTSCDLIETKTTFVKECPKNENEQIQASTKLKCGVDEYNNSQYFCLPLVNKTSLVELCFNGGLGRWEEGNCLETDGEKIYSYNCLNFSSGCPEEDFFDYEFYIYPACLNISTEFHCYLFDPFCSTQLKTANEVKETTTHEVKETTTHEVKETTTHEVEETTHGPKNNTSKSFLGVLSVVVFVLVVIFVIGIFVLKRKYWGNKDSRVNELNRIYEQGLSLLPEEVETNPPAETQVDGSIQEPETPKGDSLNQGMSTTNTQEEIISSNPETPLSDTSPRPFTPATPNDDGSIKASDTPNGAGPQPGTCTSESQITGGETTKSDSRVNELNRIYEQGLSLLPEEVGTNPPAETQVDGSIQEPETPNGDSLNQGMSTTNTQEEIISSNPETSLSDTSPRPFTPATPNEDGSIKASDTPNGAGPQPGTCTSESQITGGETTKSETQQLDKPGTESLLSYIGARKKRNAKDRMLPLHVRKNPKKQQLDNPGNENSLSFMEAQQLEYRVIKRLLQFRGAQQFENRDIESSLPFKGNEETQRDIDDEDLYSSHAENNEEIRIVLLGKTGAGKSASGNTILGDNVFVSKVSASSITSRCAYNSSYRFGHKIVIVDTPGMFDTSLENHHTQEEIRKCIAITSPGPHAFILVLSIQRYTDEEQNTVKHFVKHFGERVYNYVIVLFTRKDSLEEISLQDFIETSPIELRTLIRKCGERVIAFNNKLTGAENDEQVKGLINLILRNIEKNEGLFYTHKLYEDAEKLLKKKEKALIKLTEMEREIELQSTYKIDQVHSILSEEIEKLMQDAKNGTIKSIELQERKQEAIRRHHLEITKLQKEANEKTQEKYENKYKSTRDEVRSNIERDESFFDS